MLQCDRDKHLVSNTPNGILKDTTYQWIDIIIIIGAQQPLVHGVMTCIVLHRLD